MYTAASMMLMFIRTDDIAQKVDSFSSGEKVACVIVAIVFVALCFSDERVSGANGVADDSIDGEIPEMLDDEIGAQINSVPHSVVKPRSR